MSDRVESMLSSYRKKAGTEVVEPEPKAKAKSKSKKKAEPDPDVVAEE